MKKILFTGLLFICFISASAQKATSVPLDNSNRVQPAGLEAIESKYYCCSKCDYTALKQQNCPVHHLPLVHVGDYYCPSCGKHASAKQGNCPDHPVAKIRMNMKYAPVEPLKKNEGTSK